MENKPKTGDKIQLFLQLPARVRSSCLPIGLLPNVCFDITPQWILDNAPRECTTVVLPGYDPAGMHPASYCLHYTGRGPNQPSAHTLFFISIDALRLLKPLPMIIAGQFTLGQDEDLIQDPRLLHLISAWQPGQSEYEAEDILAASAIANRLLETREQNDVHGPDLESAVVYFSQVTAGLVQSLQLASIGLWASLEALLRPDNDLGKTLAKRVSTFLSGFDFLVDLEEWIKSEYNRRRNAYVHGQHIVQPWRPDADPAPEAFGKLHEITRLCLLGFLSMDKQELLRLQNSKKGDLKHLLNGLPRASGRFLDGQRAWLG